jgi:hypothetical protein
MMKHLFLTGALAMFLAGATHAERAQAKEPEMITLSGCVQGFAQGGYFLSDSTDKKGKPKHYLLINDNDEIKEFTGKWVEVNGQPFPFGYGVSIKAQDNRTLKTSSVFGVDTVKVLRDTCTNNPAPDPMQVAER